MRIVLYGSTGNAGSRILAELTRRGHQVTAIVRDIGKAPLTTEDVRVEQDNLSKPARTAALVQGADAVVSALSPPPDDTDRIISMTDSLVEAVSGSPHTRLVVVGGAASLFVAPGITLLASGHLPEAWRAIATSHATVLDHLRESSVDWTYFSPAAFFEPGERTGHFRPGADDLITGADGQSRISMEDYAIALVDELEHPAHRRARFTAGY